MQNDIHKMIDVYQKLSAISETKFEVISRISSYKISVPFNKLESVLLALDNELGIISCMYDSDTNIQCCYTVGVGWDAWIFVDEVDENEIRKVIDDFNQKVLKTEHDNIPKIVKVWQKIMCVLQHKPILRLSNAQYYGDMYALNIYADNKDELIDISKILNDIYGSDSICWGETECDDGNVKKTAYLCGNESLVLLYVGDIADINTVFGG